MNLKIITRDEVNFQRRTEATIRFNHSGLISLSKETSTRLNLKNGDQILFVFDQDFKTYYIGKAANGQKGFTISADKGKLTNSLKFNSSGLIDKFFKDQDLPALNKKSNISALFNVNVNNPIKQLGMTLYKLTN